MLAVQHHVFILNEKECLPEVYVVFSAAQRSIVLQKAASHGFFANLDAVLLQLCGPFLEPSTGVFWKRVDPRYVMLGTRLSFRDVSMSWRSVGTG